MTKNILLVDGDEKVRQALGRALACENYHVVPAANREEALDQFGKEQIDVILLDLNPANENDWKTVQWLTAFRPSLPVIAMTTREDQHQHGANSHAFHKLFPKPIDLYSLIETPDGITLEVREASPPTAGQWLSFS